MTENFKKLIRSYEILALKLGKASLNDIQETYRYLVKVWHPDRFGHDPKLQHIAQEKMKEINEAYQTIQDAYKNPTKYDMDEGGYSEKTDNYYQEAEVINEEEEGTVSTPPPPPTTPPPINPKKDGTAQKGNGIKESLGTRWLTFYIYILLPFRIGAGFVPVLAQKEEFRRAGYNVSITFPDLAPAIIFGIFTAVVIYGLHKRFMWGWIINWIFLGAITLGSPLSIGDLQGQMQSLTQTPSLDDINQETGYSYRELFRIAGIEPPEPKPEREIGTYIVSVVILTLIFFVPNYIYFKKRKILFT